MTLDLAKLRAETLALIDGTTPGPWREGQDGNTRVYGPDGMGDHSGLVASFCRRADTRLVTAAPTLAADTLRLLDEIERLRAENNKLREDMSGGSFYQEDDIDAMQNEIERLRYVLGRIAVQKRSDELETALAVEYADFQDGYDIMVDEARAALAEGGTDDPADLDLSSKAVERLAKVCCDTGSNYMTASQAPAVMLALSAELAAAREALAEAEKRAWDVAEKAYADAETAIFEEGRQALGGKAQGAVAVADAIAKIRKHLTDDEADAIRACAERLATTEGGA